MDIFEQAKKMDADYYDHHTGYIYHIQEYNRIKRFGLPNIHGGMRVSDAVTGEFIGIVREPKETKKEETSKA